MNRSMKKRCHKWKHLRSSTHVLCIDVSVLRSRKAVEEDGLGPEIQQHDSVWKVELTLTHEHDSKQGSQAREERR
jgi:hypothetical protein